MTKILHLVIILCTVIVCIECQAELCKDFCEANAYEAATVGDKRIRLYYREKSWQTAFDECEKSGGQLLHIKSSVLNHEIFKYLKHRIWGAGEVHTGFIHTYIWIGGTDKDKEGHFVWKPTNEAFDYTSWSGAENNHWHQPDNNKGDENCVELYIYNTRNIYWNDAPCWEKKRFICEYPRSEINI